MFLPTALSLGLPQAAKSQQSYSPSSSRDRTTVTVTPLKTEPSIPSTLSVSCTFCASTPHTPCLSFSSLICIILLAQFHLISCEALLPNGSTYVLSQQKISSTRGNFLPRKSTITTTILTTSYIAHTSLWSTPVSQQTLSRVGIELNRCDGLPTMVCLILSIA